MKSGNVNHLVQASADLVQVQPRARMDWPDVAKGLSILGVVILHVALNIPGGKESVISQINTFLDPLRMPLFFLVSGFFSVKVLHQTFGELFRTRLWFFLVPYLFWTPIDIFGGQVEGYLYRDTDLAGFGFYLLKIFGSANMYWFLYFLILFNVLLWATRKLPGWMIASVIMVVPWLFMPMFGDNEVVRKCIIYLPAFFIGAYFRPRIEKFADAASRPRAIVFAGVFYGVGMVINSLEEILTHRTPGPAQLWFIAMKNDFAALFGGELSAFDLGHFSGMLIRVISLPMGIVLAVWLAKIRPVAEMLKFFGRHTLVIYIGHSLGLTMIFGYFLKWTVMDIDADSSQLFHSTGMWMVIAFLCAMAGAYIVHLIARVPILGWALVPPGLPRPRQDETPSEEEQARRISA